MTVTKQQQLELLAINYAEWPFSDAFVFMCRSRPMEFASRSGIRITRKEWQQELDKMQKQQDDSWHDRGELPPVSAPSELWFGGSFAYNCEFICVRGHNYIVWNLDADRPDCADIMNSEFRPLRTEREKAIEEMALLAMECEKYDITQNVAKSVCELLYDAGYRKEKTK